MAIITERGRWANSTVDERGKRIFSNGLTERGQKVFGLSGGGSTNATINATIANATASSLTPTVTAQQNISFSGVVASSTADAISPQVGSFTNVTISAIAPNATASANNPSISTTSNISLGVPVSNVVASALIPNVGLSQSATISAVIASLVVDGIAPNISTSQGTMINSVVAGANAGAMSPTIQRDMVLFAVPSNAQAFMVVPAYITGTPQVVVDTITYGKSNKATIEVISRKVDIQPFYNKVDVEVIRIHTDYYFMTYSQTTSQDTEV